MKFIARCEHGGGASVGHPCTDGVYDDPSEFWEVDVDADDIDEAEELAHAQLCEAVDVMEPCRCHRRLQPGSDRWWESVCITLWPQDEAALRAWVEAGDDPRLDPYGLLPPELQRLGRDLTEAE